MSKIIPITQFFVLFAIDLLVPRANINDILSFEHYALVAIGIDLLVNHINMIITLDFNRSLFLLV